MDNSAVIKPCPPPEKKQGKGFARLVAFFMVLQGLYYAVTAEFYFVQVHESVGSIIQNFDLLHLVKDSNQKLFLLYALLAIFCAFNAVDIFLIFKHSRTRALFCQSLGLLAFIFLYFSPIDTQSIYLPMAFSITLVILLNYQELRLILEERHGSREGV